MATEPINPDSSSYSKDSVNNVAREGIQKNIDRENGVSPHSDQWNFINSPIPDAYKTQYLGDFTNESIYNPGAPMSYNPRAGLIEDRSKEVNPSIWELGRDAVVSSTGFNLLNSINIKENKYQYENRFQNEDPGYAMGPDYKWSNDNFFTPEYLKQLKQTPEGRTVYNNYLRGEYDKTTSFNTLINQVSYDMFKDKSMDNLARATGLNRFAGSLIGSFSDPLNLALGFGASGIVKYAGNAIGTGLGIGEITSQSALFGIKAVQTAADVAVFTALDQTVRASTFRDYDRQEAYDSLVNNMIFGLGTFGVMRGTELFNVSKLIREQRTANLIKENAANFEKYKNNIKSDIKNEVSSTLNELGNDIPEIDNYTNRIYEIRRQELLQQHANSGTTPIESKIKAEANQAMHNSITETVFNKQMQEPIIEGKIGDNQISFVKRFSNDLGETRTEGYVLTKDPLNPERYTVESHAYDPYTGETRVNKLQDNVDGIGTIDVSLSHEDITYLDKYINDGITPPKELLNRIGLIVNESGRVISTEPGNPTIRSAVKDFYNKTKEEILYSGKGNIKEVLMAIKDNLFENQYQRGVSFKARRTLAGKESGRYGARAEAELRSEGKITDQTSVKDKERLINDRVDQIFNKTKVDKGLTIEENKVLRDVMFKKQAFSVLSILGKYIALPVVGLKGYSKVFGPKTGVNSIDGNLSGFNGTGTYTGNPVDSDSQWAALSRMIIQERTDYENRIKPIFMNQNFHDALISNLNSIPESKQKESVVNMIKKFYNNINTAKAADFIVLNQRLSSLLLSSYPKEFNDLIMEYKSNREDLIKKFNLNSQIEFIYSKIAEGTSSLAPEFKKIGEYVNQLYHTSRTDELNSMKEAIILSMNNPIRDSIQDWNRNWDSFNDEVKARLKDNANTYNTLFSYLDKKISFDGKLISDANGNGGSYSSSIFINSIGSHIVNIIDEVMNGKYNPKEESISNVHRYEDSYKKYGSDDQIKDSLISKASSLFNPGSVDNNIKYTGSHFTDNSKQALTYGAILSKYPELASKLNDGTISDKEFNSLHKLLSINDLFGIQKVINVFNKRQTHETTILDNTTIPSAPINNTPQVEAKTTEMGNINNTINKNISNNNPIDLSYKIQGNK